MSIGGTIGTPKQEMTLQGHFKAKLPEPVPLKGPSSWRDFETALIEVGNAALPHWRSTLLVGGHTHKEMMVRIPQSTTVMMIQQLMGIKEDEEVVLLNTGLS